MGRAEAALDAFERLIGGYAIEAEIYQSLLALAREQGAILEESGDVDRCAALFERKDELLRSIARMEGELEPMKRRWREGDVDDSTRERLNTLLDCILTTIEEIMEQEQRNEQLLLSQHAQVEADLGHIQRGTEMHRTQADTEPEPRFMDVRR
jgi:hypothetical protein